MVCSTGEDVQGMHVALQSILKAGKVPGVLKERYFLVGARLWIVVAKVGACDGFKFITRMWIGSDEFGIGVSHHVFFPDREEHHDESSCEFCAENS
eukprot:1139588-Pelagomonas_calceolata.AAC.3